ncbi:Gfo/Idh/MocA family protein [Chloroflexota bacterium]
MKVGLIGAGLQGRRRAQVLREFSHMELVIVADADWQRAKLLADEMGCKATDDWEEIVARQDIETVIVCTPPNLHLPMCIAALNQGRHVLCEKPLARNPEEAKRIVDAACENNVKLKCGFNLRHHPGIAQARAWLEQGIIGEPNFLRLRYGIGGRPGYDKEWRAKVEFSGGGQLMDQGMHALDLSRWFLGDFSQAFGFLATSFWDIAPLEDNAFCLLHTGAGQIASIHVSWTQWKNMFSFELFGQEGYVIVEGLGGSYGVERAILGKRAFLEPFREEIIEFRYEDRSWYEEWLEFISSIKENRQPLGNGHDGSEALKLAHAIYESAQSGCMVKLKT